MNVFPILDAVAVTKYRGVGYALAAHDNNVVIDLVYLRDVLDWFDDPSEEEGDDVDALLRKAIEDNRLLPVIEQLRAQGAVSVGMCSCHEFVEL